jgi:8-oxo-dGTP diphosphatase
MDTNKMVFLYDHARPAIAVDCAVFGLDANVLKLLLIRRSLKPFKGHWALPGGFVRMQETLDGAALRELHEETGLKDVFLEQLYSFGAVDRDPRERVVSVSYYALVKLSDHRARAATDASDAEWFSLDSLPALAFDHGAIVEMARTRLQGKLRYQPVGFELLPRKFTLSDLQGLYEAILGTALDKRNFRKKVLELGLLEPLQETRMNGRHRPAQLFRFNAKKYEALRKRGFNFEPSCSQHEFHRKEMSWPISRISAFFHNCAVNPPTTSSASATAA